MRNELNEGDTKTDKYIMKDAIESRIEYKPICNSCLNLSLWPNSQQKKAQRTRFPRFLNRISYVKDCPH